MRLLELLEDRHRDGPDDGLLNTHGSVNESFFSDNMDILMPIVRGLMKTAARPLIYKLWQTSPNAVLALAAIKKLKDQGDKNPITTILSLSNLDVPSIFLKRLAYDAGVFDIGGVSRRRKPKFLPVIGENDENDINIHMVYHGTFSDNLDDILENGIEAPSYWGPLETAKDYGDLIFTKPAQELELEPNNQLADAYEDIDPEVYTKWYSKDRSWEDSIRWFGGAVTNNHISVDRSDIH
jgi:hypothetical protein